MLWMMNLHRLQNKSDLLENCIYLKFNKTNVLKQGGLEPMLNKKIKKSN